jgi:hypothetical protein
MSQNSTGTVWDVNNTVYPWNDWNSAGTVSVTTVNAADNGKKITIQGLDDNYKFQEETITMSSSSNTASTLSFVRLNRGFVFDGATNIADVLVTKNSNTVLKINAGKGQTLMAIFTIPADKTGYLCQGTASIQSGADATADMFIRYFNQTSFRVGHSFEVSGAGGQYEYKFTTPIPIPEKSDIDVRTSVRSNNARLTAAFDIILIDN